MISEFQGKYRFLSNFYPAEVLFESKVYPSTEHFYQAMKFVKEERREEIRNCASPGAAKRIARTLPTRPDWERIRVQVMLFALRQKFMQPGLCELLISTGVEDLVEGNKWHDNFWGACSCQTCTKREKFNMLGRLLMQVRKEILSNPNSMFWR